MTMSTMSLSAQEVERITVFRIIRTALPIFDAPEGIVAYVVDPSTGAVFTESPDIETATHAIMKRGMIAYAVGEIADPLGEETYWTTERLQRLFDHHRQRYVNGE